MYCSANVIKGCAIQARDGQMGKIDDFYFDDGSWHVRYLVVDVGNWLKHDRVLLIPKMVTAVDPDEGILDVSISKAEVAASPNALEHPTVSRQAEIALHRHYDWTPYWETDPVGTAAFGNGPTELVTPGAGVKADVDVMHDANALVIPELENLSMHEMVDRDLRPTGRLRGTSEVRGYSIHASDGEIGHVSDFFLTAALNQISYLVIDTGNWLPGRKVVIPPAFVRSIQWNGSRVDLALTRAEIRNTPGYDEEAFPFISSDFENALRDYYHTHRMY